MWKNPKHDFVVGEEIMYEEYRGVIFKANIHSSTVHIKYDEDCVYEGRVFVVNACDLVRYVEEEEQDE
jgi:hypothetical protein